MGKRVHAHGVTTFREAKEFFAGAIAYSIRIFALP